jgi:hypothetical protein
MMRLDKTDLVMVTLLIPCVIMIAMLIHDGVKTYNETGYFQVEKNSVILEAR